MPNSFSSRTGTYAELALAWGSYLLAGIAGISLVSMMVTIVVDVVYRYLLDAPLVGAHDLVQLSMVVITFCSLAYTGIKGAHITVDLFNPVLARIRPSWVDALLYRLVMFMAAGTLLWIAYLSWNRMPQSDLMKEASNMIGVPHYPFYGVIAVGLGFYGLVLLADAIRGQRTPVNSALDDMQEEAQ